MKTKSGTVLMMRNTGFRFHFLILHWCLELKCQMSVLQKPNKGEGEKTRQGFDRWPMEENIKADGFRLAVGRENKEGLQAHAAGHSRVVDNLEAIPFFERQVVGRPCFVVVQCHKECHATCRRAEGQLKQLLMRVDRGLRDAA